MKFFVLLFMLSSQICLAQTWDLISGVSSYEVKVKAFMKKVQSESKEVKGKMDCPDKECEVLLAVPVKSYTSSDSNRDLNMRSTVEAAKYPYSVARGKFSKNLLQNTKWKLPAEIEFHGVKKKYEIDIEKTSDNSFKASFILKLEEHAVKLPSLFGIKVDNDVPMTFDLNWQIKS